MRIECDQAFRHFVRQIDCDEKALAQHDVSRGQRLPVLAIEACDFARGLAIGCAFLQIGAFVARDFSLGDAELGFEPAIFPMQVKNYQRAPAYLRFAIKLVDLSAMEQEFADAFRRGHFVTGAFVRLNVGIVEKCFAFFDPSEGIVDVGFTGANRFDLASLQLDAGLVAFENVKVAERFAIENGFGRHEFEAE